MYTFTYYNSLLQFQQIESWFLITGQLCHLYSCPWNSCGIGKREEKMEMHLVQRERT